MAKLMALYNTPSDPAAFDAYYRGPHMDIARRMPGLKSVEVSTGPVMTPAGLAPFHTVGILGFESMADLQNALASPEGLATGADLPKFATGGVTLLVFDSDKLL